MRRKALRERENHFDLLLTHIRSEIGFPGLYTAGMRIKKYIYRLLLYHIEKNRKGTYL